MPGNPFYALADQKPACGNGGAWYEGMAEESGDNVSMKQGGHGSGSAAAGAVKPGNAVENTRRHKFKERQGHRPVHKHENGGNKDQRPSNIK